MPLNKSKGNMYDFITHTWNTVKGECFHDCSYCYMKKWGKLKPVRFDEKELKTDLGNGNFIFVGSSCDMFSESIPDEWIRNTLNYCNNFDNKYLFQSKNPRKFLDYLDENTGIIDKAVLCTTFETNRHYPEIMRKSPFTFYRSIAMHNISYFVDTYITIEPILDFDLRDMVKYIKYCNPKQVNIGADSGNNNLPEPPKEKILNLISELEKFTKVNKKLNLKRILEA